MKLKNTLLLLLLSAAFISCSDDDDDVKTDQRIDQYEKDIIGAFYGLKPKEPYAANNPQKSIFKFNTDKTGIQYYVNSYDEETGIYTVGSPTQRQYFTYYIVKKVISEYNVYYNLNVEYSPTSQFNFESFIVGKQIQDTLRISSYGNFTRVDPSKIVLDE